VKYVFGSIIVVEKVGKDLSWLNEVFVVSSWSFFNSWKIEDF